MYAHDLIESLKNTQNDNFGIKSKRIEALQNSHHFFLGDMGDMLSLAGKSFCDGTPYFQDSLLEYANPPYQKTCIHFSVSAKDIFLKSGEIAPINHIDLYSKKVFLIDHCVDGLILHEWTYFPNRQCWSTTIFVVVVELHCADGKTMISNHYPKDFSAEISEKDEFDAKEHSMEIIHCVNLALLLLNTKNIVTQEHRPPAKLNKKRVKKGKQPLFTYHTLRLQLPGKTKKGSGISETGDNTTRLHLCRGHFKTYTEDNPLFGKLTGRYWWQPHARGDKTKGVVMKDYKVETGFKKKEEWHESSRT